MSLERAERTLAKVANRVIEIAAGSDARAPKTLDMIISLCNYLRVTHTAIIPIDPTLEVAERQLATLRELHSMAMDVSRAFASSAKASAKAEEAILADEYFMPEVGRARACGAKDAAESFQKVTRAVRLTLKLEMAVAETVRDLRAGVQTTARVNNAGVTTAVSETILDRPRPAGPSPDREALDTDRHADDRECLVDVERADVFRRAPFRETVDHIRADLDVTIDWNAWKVGEPDVGYEALQPKLAGWKERPPLAVSAETALPLLAGRSP